MEAEDRVDLVEGILDIARDEELADGDNHAVSRILVRVLDACSGEDKDLRNRNEVNQLIREREVARQEAFEVKQAFERSCGMRDKMSYDMSSLRKELDEAKWDRAQLNKELELYRPKPTEEAKP
jgi:hypothetical protein